MKTILEIKQSDVEPRFTMPKTESWYVRHAARAVLFDENSRIALLHAKKRDYYKLPGGGVEANEDMHAALARELMEEIGAEAEVISEIGRVEEWRCFEEQTMHQISDAYIAKVTGAIGQPDFTEKEIAEGFSVAWASDLKEAVTLVKKAMNSQFPEVRFMAMRDSAILKAAR